MQSNIKNVFAAIAKTRLIGFSDKVESQTDKIDSLADKNESRLGQIVVSDLVASLRKSVGDMP